MAAGLGIGTGGGRKPGAAEASSIASAPHANRLTPPLSSRLVPPSATRGEPGPLAASHARRPKRARHAGALPSHTRTRARLQPSASTSPHQRRVSRGIFPRQQSLASAHSARANATSPHVAGKSSHLAASQATRSEPACERGTGAAGERGGGGGEAEVRRTLRLAAAHALALKRECTFCGLRMTKPSFTNLRTFCPETMGLAAQPRCRLHGPRQCVGPRPRLRRAPSPPGRLSADAQRRGAAARRMPREAALGQKRRSLEFAMLISLTSFGSSQILRLPHLSTDAASRFCSSKETPIAESLWRADVCGQARSPCRRAAGAR